MKLHLLCATTCALSLISTASSAALIISDPYYSAPGGYTSSSSGGPAQIAEQVKTYVGFDNSAYDSLFYAFGDSGPIGTWDTFLPAGPSLYAGTTGEMKNPLAYDATLSNFGAGLSVWSGSITTDLFGAPTSIDARFTMNATDISGAVLTLTDAASLGLDASLGGVLNVNGDFKVALNALLMNTGSSFTYNPGSGPVICNTGDWCHALKVYDNLNGKSPSSTLYTSYDNAFYSSPVPVPAAVWLFGSGLIGLIGVARRKKA